MENYRVLKVVGKGSFGKAVLSRRKVDNLQVIVKKIPMASLTAKEIEETENEVKCLAALQHPYIVPYYDSFKEKNAMHIVMGYADGGDLKKKIEGQRGVHFKEDQILDWFVQISLALKHLHDRKMMHRDLKTENVFMTASNICMLGDFGIAKVLEHTMAMAATSCGTPIYMSPEVCQDQPYNVKADIWSMGCILYEMANLQYCFMGRNMKELIFKIVRGKFDPIKARYSQNLKGLVGQLLAVEPDDRPVIGDIVGRGFIRGRVGRLLTNKQIREEFGSTGHAPIDLDKINVGGVDGAPAKAASGGLQKRRSQSVPEQPGQAPAQTPAERRAARRQSAVLQPSAVGAKEPRKTSQPRASQFPWQAAQAGAQPQQRQAAPQPGEKKRASRATFAPGTNPGMRRVASEYKVQGQTAEEKRAQQNRRQSSGAQLGGKDGGRGGRLASMDSVVEDDDDEEEVVEVNGASFNLDSPSEGGPPETMASMRAELNAKGLECAQLRQTLQQTQGRVQQTETKLRVAQDKLQELDRLLKTQRQRAAAQPAAGGAVAAAANPEHTEVAFQLQQVLDQAAKLVLKLQQPAGGGGSPRADSSWEAIESAATAVRMQITNAADVAADAGRNLRSTPPPSGGGPKPRGQGRADV
jgi:NIMA (never in mitosis gene a)-related kinase